MLRLLLISSALLSLTTPSRATPINIENLLTGYDPIHYQIGSEWGRTEVTEASLQNENAGFLRAAKATAYIPSGGTGFYLGKFNGVHVVATNHHVCETGAQCLGFDARFPIIRKSYRLEKWLGTFKNIDLTLMTLRVPPQDEELMKSIAANFEFKKDLQRGQKLAMIGFGAAGNPNRSLVGTQDSDCVVLSDTADYRFLQDPDTLNPGPDLVWSFANGCDVSHGDSGSAMVDRQTGEVMGIIWTGQYPKDQKIQNSSYVQSLLSAPNEDIWTQVSYAVPAAKMADAIYEYAFHYPYMTPDVRATLLKIIDRK